MVSSKTKFGIVCAADDYSGAAGGHRINRNLTLPLLAGTTICIEYVTAFAGTSCGCDNLSMVYYPEGFIIVKNPGP
jgi:hypothetical protein